MAFWVIAKTIKKTKKLSALFGYIFKLILASSDSFCLIASHLLILILHEMSPDWLMTSKHLWPIISKGTFVKFEEKLLKMSQKMLFLFLLFSLHFDFWRNHQKWNFLLLFSLYFANLLCLYLNTNYVDCKVPFDIMGHISDKYPN